MAKDKKEYDVFKGLLSGKQVNTLDKDVSLSCVQELIKEQLGNSVDVYVLHDPCEIRKPDSEKMENIGRVLSLQKISINGYKTFNSVAVNPLEQNVNLLYHRTYSTGMPEYIKEEVLSDINNAPNEIQELVKEDKYINTKKLFKEAIEKSNKLLKSSNPNVKILHVSDREFDSEELFDFIDQVGDDFVMRMKLNRLSNKRKTLKTPTGRISKRIAYHKLIDIKFENKFEYEILKLEIKGKCYHNVRLYIETDTLKLEKKTYNVLRITLKQENRELFKQPMILITNRSVVNAEQAKQIYRAYILRFKIEVVFRFLKQNLGWEDFQVRDFRSIENLLALAFFLVGYFKELEEELKKHPLAEFICSLASSKGKITIFYLLKGIEKMIHFQQVSIWMKEYDITSEQIDEIVEYLNVKYME